MMSLSNKGNQSCLCQFREILGNQTWIYFDNADDNVTLTLHTVTVTSQKSCQHHNKCDCSKTQAINEVYGGSIKCCNSNILLKIHKLHLFC